MNDQLGDRLEHLNAGVALGLASGDEAVRLACDLLVTGVDTPAVAELAGESPKAVSWADAGPLVQRALAELGIAPVSAEPAQWILARHIARRTLGGDLSLSDGAAELLRLCEQGDPGHELAKQVTPLDIAVAMLSMKHDEATLAEVRELVEDILRVAEERLR